MKFECELQETQRLESLGLLAGGISHDFNNLLTGILGNASLALSDTTPDQPMRIRLRQIVEAAERAAFLTRQMLAYAGYPGTHHRMPVCCEVMRRLMSSRDQVVAGLPKGKGATLVV